MEIKKKKMYFHKMKIKEIFLGVNVFFVLAPFNSFSFYALVLVILTREGG